MLTNSLRSLGRLSALRASGVIRELIHDCSGCRPPDVTRSIEVLAFAGECSRFKNVHGLSLAALAKADGLINS